MYLDALQSGDLFKGLRRVNYQYVVKDILEVDHLENKIDILSSRATLEHFEFFEEGVRVLYELMSNGGTAFHLIDLRDHRAYYSIEFNFWSFLTENGSFLDFNSNRLRASEILSILEKVGYNILDIGFQKSDFLPEVAPFLLSKYQCMSIDELEKVSILITLKKS